MRSNDIRQLAVLQAAKGMQGTQISIKRRVMPMQSDETGTQFRVRQETPRINLLSKKQETINKNIKLAALPIAPKGLHLQSLQNQLLKPNNLQLGEKPQVKDR